MFLSLRSKNLNAEVKEINVLLNFSQIHLLPTSPAFGYKSLRELICRCPSNAEANAVHKVSYAGVFLPLAKRLLKTSEGPD